MSKKIFFKFLIILCLYVIPIITLCRIVFGESPLIDKDTDGNIAFFLIIYVVLLMIVTQLRASEMGTFTQKDSDKSFKHLWGKCPHCLEKVNTFADRCPHCREEI
ncbi:MAG: hypothetical protein Q8L07_14615 [Sediminibacterium sp.]|nr:hypothetical protein [Sediminibacterium sp.]